MDDTKLSNLHVTRTVRSYGNRTAMFLLDKSVRCVVALEFQVEK